MPLGLGSGFWAIALPVAKTNQTLNPSYEYGTLGVAAIQSATIGSTSQFQQFGAWSCSITPNSNGTSGAALGTWTATNGAPYTVSAYVRGVNGVPYMIGVGDSNGVNILGSTAFTGGGTWQRYAFSFTEAAGAVRRVVVRKTSGADTTAFYVDGVQIELGSITTYLDGDQPGGTWNGAPHASTSGRSGQARSGGSVVALADLGWQVDQMPGVGMPGLENSSQSYAVIDGAQYQRTRAAQRSFTLTAKPIMGTTTQDYHVTRRTIIDALKIDAFTPQQPSRFYYVGGQGTVQIDAVYDHGLELGNMTGPMAEDLAVSFQAYDPYWYAPTNEGTTFAANLNLGSTNFIVKRSPTGVWGTLGQANGSTFQANVAPTTTAVEDLLFNPGGTLFLSGYFGTISGTVGNGVGMYFPETNRFGTLTGGTIGVPGAEVPTMALAPSGSLYFGGNFVIVGGTTSPRIGQWNGAFGTLTGGGTLDSLVQKLLYSPTGTLFVGGAFSIAGGTTARFLAQWAGGQWGTLSQNAGTINNGVRALTWALDNSLYVGGLFGSAGGTAMGSVARWNGAWGSLASGANAIVWTLATKPDARIAAGGQFTTMGGITAGGLSEWAGAGWTPDGAGANGIVRHVFARQDNSLIVAGSWSSIGGVAMPDPIAIWNGASYLPIGIDLPNSVAGAFPPTIYAVAEADDRTLYIGGDFAGTALAAVAGSVVNTGRALAYPTLRLRNLAAGTASVYYLINFTTGAGLYFNLSLLAGEVAELVLEPGNRSFTSSFRPNLFSAILPGSNLATWNLQPGTNSLSFYADNSGLETSLYWQPRGWSIDSGTVY